MLAAAVKFLRRAVEALVQTNEIVYEATLFDKKRHRSGDKIRRPYDQ